MIGQEVSAQGSKRVLVVEDDRDILDSLEIILQDNGYEVALSSEVSVTYLTPQGLLRLARLVRGQLRDDEDG